MDSLSSSGCRSHLIRVQCPCYETLTYDGLLGGLVAAVRYRCKLYKSRCISVSVQLDTSLQYSVVVAGIHTFITPGALLLRARTHGLSAKCLTKWDLEV